MKKMKNRIINIFASVIAVAAITSCDSFLDVTPDKRAVVDTQEEVQDLLVSAYPDVTYLAITEYMSDNVENLGDNISGSTRQIEQLYYWNEIVDENNDSPKDFWDNCYKCIATANSAIAKINDLGGPEAGLQAEMAEALLCRAYAHFMLVNIFCQNYSSKTSGSDLGIPYMTKSETTLNPKYERGTVKDVYEHIEEDILAALPYVTDAYYDVPKYHFTPSAAYAFASRFYLFYEKWDLAIDYATKCLGDYPASVLRDWQYRSTLADSRQVKTLDFINESKKSNLLLLTGVSQYGICFAYPAAYPKYSHTNYLGATETCFAKNVWGNTSVGYGGAARYYYDPAASYVGGNFSQVALFKIPYLFEYTDPVNDIGYPHVVYPAFTTDEILLNRAEAYILTGDYERACEDLNIWIHNILNPSYFNKDLTPDMIKSFYDATPYARWDNFDPSTRKLQNNIKKQLHPKFEIPSDPYAEPMLQCVLQFKRIENLTQGLRWFDIKRYGIEIWRRTLKSDSASPVGYSPARLDDVLTVDDPRRAVQLPQEVILAGLDKNPR